MSHRKVLKGTSAKTLLFQIIHHIHKALPCNFEIRKMPAAKQGKEQQERSCQNASHYV